MKIFERYLQLKSFKIFLVYCSFTVLLVVIGLLQFPRIIDTVKADFHKRNIEALQEIGTTRNELFELSYEKVVEKMTLLMAHYSSVSEEETLIPKIDRNSSFFRNLGNCSEEFGSLGEAKEGVKRLIEEEAKAAREALEAENETTRSCENYYGIQLLYCLVQNKDYDYEGEYLDKLISVNGKKEHCYLLPLFKAVNQATQTEKVFCDYSSICYPTMTLIVEEEGFSCYPLCQVDQLELDLAKHIVKEPDVIYAYSYNTSLALKRRVFLCSVRFRDSKHNLHFSQLPSLESNGLRRGSCNPNLLQTAAKSCRRPL